MPEIVIRLNEAEAALLGTLGDSEGLSVEEIAVQCVLERLKRVQDEAFNIEDWPEDNLQ